MSYSATLKDIKTMLEANVAVSAYNFNVTSNFFSRNDNHTNAHYTIEIDVPEGEIIEFLNDELASQAQTDDSDWITENYNYLIKLRTSRRGFEDFYEIYDDAQNTIFDFAEDVYNAFFLNWQINTTIVQFEAGNISKNSLDEDGNLELNFVVKFQTQIEVTQR